MSPEKQETADPHEQFQLGDYVKHPKFGEGQILQRTGSGEDTKFVVSFSEEGEKRLLAAFAKLKKIRSIDGEEPEGEEAKKDAGEKKNAGEEKEGVEKESGKKKETK